MSAAAPVLSTYQDEDTFVFDKCEDTRKIRNYLGPGWEDDATLKDKIREYFAVDELVKVLSERDKHGNTKFKKITLQFPDTLVADSPIVVQMLQDELDVQENQNIEHSKRHHHKEDEEANAHRDKHKDEKKDDCTHQCANCKCSDPLETKKDQDNTQHVWILADTAYSACCIDEVAAEHVSADIVVHFGDACLNAIQKLPAVYVFGKPHLDLDATVSKFKEVYSNVEEKVVLMADAPNTRYLPEIFNALKNTYKNIVFADINLEKADKATIVGFESSHRKGSARFSNRILISSDENLDLEENDLSDYNLFHINTPQPPHLLFLTTKFSGITIYDPDRNDTDQGPFPSLMKRYRYMQLARTAGTIGILVNTLSLRNTTEMIKVVSRKIKEADKKYYMFVVGKPNVAKLANFESIEVWCILGCGQGGIVIDSSNEFYRPIITPYELELALSPQVQWTGKWVTDFENLIKDDEGNETESDGATDSSVDVSSPADNDMDDDAPEFNSVTGKFVTTSRPLRQIQHLEIDSSDSKSDENQLVKKFSEAVMIKGTISTSAIHLQNREWTGLGSDYASNGVDEKGALVEEGRGGVARGYQYDVQDK